MRGLPLMLLLVLLSFPLPIHAQGNADTTDVPAIVQAALESAGDPSRTSAEMVTWLTELVQRPLDLNRATAAELTRLPGVSMPLARRVVRRREANGPYASLSELRSVEGFDAATYRAARPFLTIGTIRSDRSDTATGRAGLVQRIEGRFIQRLTRRIDVGRGYRPDTAHTTYAGSPARLYTRLQLSAGRQLSLNLTLEKDPGEAFQWRPRANSYGFDHVATHLVLHHVGPFETLVVGDFGAAFGQGVALSRGFTFSKGRDAVAPPARRGAGLTPYGSTGENRYFPSDEPDIAP